VRKPKDAPPPELCLIPNEDRALLESMAKEAVSTMYVGTVKSGEDYRDIYIVITTSMIPNIIFVRRVCTSRRTLEEALTTENLARSEQASVEQTA